MKLAVSCGACARSRHHPDPRVASALRLRGGLDPSLFTGVLLGVILSRVLQHPVNRFRGEVTERGPGRKNRCMLCTL